MATCDTKTSDDLDRAFMSLDIFATLCLRDGDFGDDAHDRQERFLELCEGFKDRIIGNRDKQKMTVQWSDMKLYMIAHLKELTRKLEEDRC